MVDMGGNFTGYTTDMSRVFSVGKLPDLALKAHDTSLKIQQEIIRTAHPGVPAAELYNLAARMAEEAGLSAYFMGHRQQAGFVGHGIGIEINEQPVLAPRSKEVLKAGMVFALEPKFVIPEVGAVGVENSFEFLSGKYKGMFPEEEARIRESWKRAFEIDNWTIFNVCGNLWEIRKEWVKKIVHPGETVE